MAKQQLGLYRSTVEDRVTAIAEKRANDTHDAFLRLVFYLVTGQAYDDLEEDDIVDGLGEYQIDVLHLDTTRREDLATVTLIQGTFSDSLSSTKLIKMHAGLDYLLNQLRSIFQRLTNVRLRDKIQEFRTLRSEVLPSNVRLQVYYACLGDASKISGEFREQIERIRNDYRDTVGEFIFQPLGPAEIFDLLNRRERHRTKAGDKIAFIYDQNKANLLEHASEDVSGIICTCTGAEIARLVNTHDSVFDENLRRFLGFGGGVNLAIKGTCSSQDTAPLFWFLNNGITIVCDGFEVHKDYDNPFIEVSGIRIVNGCQTSTTLAKSQLDGSLASGTKVMVRILRTRSADLASRLLVTTNTQNKVTSRDLHAQDQIQAAIQHEFDRRFHIRFERTANEFAESPKTDGTEIVSNQKIGQAFLAIARRRPSDARRRVYKIWEVDYSHIFNEHVFPETYLFVYRLAQACERHRANLLAEFEKEELSRFIMANGIYHIARIVSYSWRRNDDWSDVDAIRRDLQRLTEKPDSLKSHIERALALVSRLVEKNPEFSQDPSTALKSARLDEAIDRALYSGASAKKRRKPRVSVRAK